MKTVIYIVHNILIMFEEDLDINEVKWTRKAGIRKNSRQYKKHTKLYPDPIQGYIMFKYLSVDYILLYYDTYKQTAHIHFTDSETIIHTESFVCLFVNQKSCNWHLTLTTKMYSQVVGSDKNSETPWGLLLLVEHLQNKLFTTHGEQMGWPGRGQRKQKNKESKRRETYTQFFNLYVPSPAQSPLRMNHLLKILLHKFQTQFIKSNRKEKDWKRQMEPKLKKHISKGM